LRAYAMRWRKNYAAAMAQFEKLSAMPPEK
jgi:hypothetical protein